MMNKRTLYILLGVLVAQVALVVGLWWPRDAAVAAEPLLPGLAVTQITAFTVSAADDSQVRLARAGAGWVLPEAEDYPAQTEVIDEALAKLAALTRGNAVTETAASHARLQVGEEDFVRRITLELADGATPVLYVGSSPSYSDSYVRLTGEEAVYQGRGVSSWEWSATPSGWVDTQYVNIPLEEVSALRIVNAQGELALTRLDSGGWALADQPADFKLDDSAVNTLAQQATSLRLAAPLGKALLPAYGLDAPLATVAITTATGETTLLVGAVQADGNYAVKSSGAEYVVSVASYAAESLVAADAESLRQAEAAAVTPTPAVAE